MSTHAEQPDRESTAEESTSGAPSERGEEPPLPRRLPEDTQDWRALEHEVRARVRRELGDGLRDRVDSLDVTQEVLLQVTRDLAKFDPSRGTDVTSWVAGIVRNRIRNLADFHRAQRRDHRREQHGDEETRLPEIPGADGPTKDLEQAELTQRLLAALEMLPPTARTLIELRDYEGCSWETIAERSGRPSPDAARVAYARALTRLVGALEGPRSPRPDPES